MQRFVLFVVLSPLFLAGCQADWTQHRSNLLSRTVPDLYYGQVLDNLALAVAKPDALPYFGLPAQGTTTNTRLLSATYTPTAEFTNLGASFLRWILELQSLAVGGSNSDSQAFQITAETNPDKLVLLWEVFHLATGYKATWSGKDPLAVYYCYHRPSPAALSSGSLGGGRDSAKPPDPCHPEDRWTFCNYQESLDRIVRNGGWRHISRNKRDVPWNACCVGRCCDVYAWADTATWLPCAT